MVLGVDHLALSCGPIDVAVRAIVTAGISAKFVQKDVPNHPSKRAFLRQYQPIHALAYCRGNGGPAIELTEHGTPLGKDVSPYQVLMRGPFQGPKRFDGDAGAWDTVWRSGFGCARPAAAYWPSLNLQFWRDENDGWTGPPEITAVLVRVADLDRSVAFWTGAVGCRRRTGGGGPGEPRWTRVAFPTPVPTLALEVVLAEGDEPSAPACLDSAGMTCVALVTTNLQLDRCRLVEAGARESGPAFDLIVNGRSLRIGMLRGPDDELLELIEVMKPDSKSGEREH